MTKLSTDDVRHIAKLCRLNLSDEQVEKFSTELSSILAFVAKLQEVNTENVEPTPQATGLTNGFREDVVVTDGPASDALLGTSALPIIDHQIQTPSAHG